MLLRPMLVVVLSCVLAASALAPIVITAAPQEANERPVVGNPLVLAFAEGWF